MIAGWSHAASRSPLLASSVVVVAVVAIGVVLVQRDDPLSDDGPSTKIEKVHFRSNGAPVGQKVLDLGGLMIHASCRKLGQRYPALQVTAQTKLDDSAAAVFFGEDANENKVAAEYAFNLSDFDRAFEWDFLGSESDASAGTFSYVRPDGGQVTLTFLADEATGQVACLFAGNARFIP